MRQQIHAWRQHPQHHQARRELQTVLQIPNGLCGDVIQETGTKQEVGAAVQIQVPIGKLMEESAGTFQGFLDCLENPTIKRKLCMQTGRHGPNKR